MTKLIQTNIYQIGDDVFIINEFDTPQGQVFEVVDQDMNLQKGLPGGGQYETESGAAWAILQVYHQVSGEPV